MGNAIVETLMKMVNDLLTDSIVRLGREPARCGDEPGIEVPAFEHAPLGFGQH
jgi:hypothetical protein